MVQIIENWSDVRGRVASVERTSAPGTRLTLEIHVLEARSVSGFPNLLEGSVGHVISLRGPDVARVPQVGEIIRCRVRKADGHRFFFAPDTLSLA